MSGLAVPSFIVSRFGSGSGVPHLVVTTLSAKTKFLHRYPVRNGRLGADAGGGLEVAPGTSASAPASTSAEAPAKGTAAHAATEAT